MNKIGVGLSSFGMSGQVFHGPLLSVNPSFEIKTILERNKNISEKIFPDARIVRTFEDLLEDENIDLCVINTPDPYHYEMTLAALKAGKSVVVEKPFVKDSVRGQELIDMAKDQGLLLSVFQNRRWDGDFLTIRKILDQGMLGRLVEYEAHFDRYRNFIQENTWKEESGSGSTIYNLGSHLIDQAIVLFGKPENVFADIRILRGGGSVDDSFTLLLDYEGTKVTLKASYLVKEPGPRYYLHGTEGSYLKYGIDPQEEALKSGELPGGNNWGIEAKTDWGILNTAAEGHSFNGRYKTLPGSYTDYYNDIARALKEGTEPSVTAEQANLVIKIIEAALESHRLGKKIKV
ncbi:Gfo/Idh/MocA family oxidoreductase [Bacteroidota bacterium]